MKGYALKLATLAAGALVVLSACGSSGSSGSSSAAGAASKIAFLLPDKDTARYDQKDNPLFTAKFKQLCPNVDIVYTNSDNKSDTQLANAEAAFAQNPKVMVLDPVDADAAGKIVTEAQGKGIKVISYDRLVKGGVKPDYYVEFDSNLVGKLQGQSLLDKLKADGHATPNILMINGAPTDNNAKLFSAGAHAVLDSTSKIVKEDAMANWKAAEAQTITEGAIGALGKNGFDGILAANDSGAAGAIAAMKANGVDPKTHPTTGQDAELAGIQRIVAGEQFMTVYKPIKALAEASAAAACDLANGKDVSASFTGKENNGTADIPANIIPVVATTLDGKIANTKSVMDSVVADGFYKVPEICTADFAAACTAAGIK